MTKPVVRLRPHHFRCALGYEGKGYSPDFTRNMTEVVMGRLRAPGGGEVMIEVTGAADTLCAPCPRRRGTGCEAQAKIDALDMAHAGALRLAPGDRVTWGEAKRRIVERVAPGDLPRICAGCAWQAGGMCEAALTRLHADP
ncbi:DUF1284 domain-containing protein [Halodurantibacterium flavum]|uniref:DUF1284 domain-containing protein n=1 Tax=Halodurantibacterium flavum TaxID=1382802 RepID=A0ABW4S568_9RHOB